MDFFDGVDSVQDGVALLCAGISLVLLLMCAGCGEGPRCTPSATPVIQAEQPHLCPGGICK